MRDIVYVAGETSGDRHGAALHRELLRTLPEGAVLRAVGLGGALMREAGVELLADSSRWGAIGVMESLAGISTYIKAMQHLKRELKARKPDALILIDFGYFNMILARWAKRNGIGPIIYYMPPGSWRRPSSNDTGNRSKELASLCDLIITPFQWSRDHLAAAGANVRWVGHPLRDIAKPVMTETEFDHAYGIDPGRAIVALLPGSRKPEIEHNLPMMLRAAARIGKRVQGAQFLLAAAPNLTADEVERMLNLMRSEQAGSAEAHTGFHIIEHAGDKLREIASQALHAASPSPALVTSEGIVLGGNASDEELRLDALAKESAPARPAQAPTLALVRNLTYDCLAHSDMAIICSGTATLESAILGRPMIIVYRGSALMEFEYHLRKRSLEIKFIGLPNIIAGEKIVPELLQHDASAEAVSELAVDLLLEPERLMRAKKMMEKHVQPQVGAPGAVERAAALIWECIESTAAAA